MIIDIVYIHTLMFKESFIDFLWQVRRHRVESNCDWIKSKICFNIDATISITFSSNSCPEIKRIHNGLIKALINGHVGQNENSKTYVRWKMGFRNYYEEETTEIEGTVMGNFEYLENIGKLSPGEYKVLKEIFAEDRKAIGKIDKAFNEINNIRPTAKSSNSKKGEFLVTNILVF